MREGSGGEVTVDHGWDMPTDAQRGLEHILQEEKDAAERENAEMGVEPTGPFLSKRLGVSDCKLIDLERSRECFCVLLN